jgi:hypothetical protein
MESRSNKLSVAAAWGAICIGLIVAIAGINLGQALRRVPPAPHYTPTVPANVVERSEQRFASLRDALKSHHVRGKVGYLADLPAERLRENAAAMEELFLAQFTLAPVVLETDLAVCTWAVTNFHDVSAAERVPREFRVVEDFGGGVQLRRRESP